MSKTLLATPLALGALLVASVALAAGSETPGIRTLWKQMGTPSGSAFISDAFQGQFNVDDSTAADDFRVKNPNGWMVEEVDVAGVYFNGSGPAQSEQVTFYKDAGGVPGAVVKSFTVNGTDNGGSFSLRIPKTKLAQGTYWMSVVANMDLEVGGEWGWSNQGKVRLQSAVWEGPSGSRCPTWCQQDGGQDEMFVIKGRQR